MSGAELFSLALRAIEILRENPKRFTTKGSFKMDLYEEFIKRYPELTGAHHFISDLSDELLSDIRDGNPDSVTRFAVAFTKYCKEHKIPIDYNQIAPLVVEQVKEGAIFNEANFRKFVLTEMTDISDGVAELKESVDKGFERMKDLLGTARMEADEASGISVARKPQVFLGERPFFVGRKSEISSIGQLLETKKPISIVGEGGLGKSSLAFKAIHQMEDLFDLIIPIYFEKGISFESVLDRLAFRLQLSNPDFLALSVKERSEVLIDSLVSAGSVLIFGDNYEVISQNNTDENVKIHSFLSTISANVAILITSRKKTNIDNEQLLSLDGLPVSDGVDLFKGLVRKPLDVSGEVAKMLETVISKTGGHPLAIELLSRSYRGGGIDELKKMNEHLGMRTTNPFAEHERLKSLKACFDYSLDLLNSKEKKCIKELTLFSSYFVERAVREITSNKSGTMLEKFYDLSLLRKLYLSQSATLDQYCYYFHPIVKEYLASSIDGKALWESHKLSFYRFFLKEAESIRKSQRIEDRISLVSLLRLTLESGDNDLARAHKLASAPTEKSAFLYAIGRALHDTGRNLMVAKYYYDALSFDEAAGDLGKIRLDYHALGELMNDLREHEREFEFHSNAFSKSAQLGDFAGMAIDKEEMGLAKLGLGEYDEALRLMSEVMRSYESLPNSAEKHAWMASCYLNKGIVLDRMNRYDEAIHDYEQSKDIAEKLGLWHLATKAYSNLATIYLQKNNPDKALDYLDKSISKRTQSPDDVGLANNYFHSAEAYFQKENYLEAEKWALKALDIYERIQHHLHIIGCLDELVRIADKLSKSKDADDYRKRKSEVEKLLKRE